MAGRPRKFDLDPLQDRLRTLLHENNYSISQIRELLLQEGGVPLNEVPSASTINRKLKEWGIRIKDQPEDVQEAALRARDPESIYNDADLIEKVRELRASGLRSGKMLKHLKKDRWPDLTSKQLKRLRTEAGIFLRGQVGNRKRNTRKLKQLSARRSSPVNLAI